MMYTTQRTSYTSDLLQHSAVSVANVIANVTALVVTKAIRRRALQMRMQRAMRLGSLPGRTFQPRTRRSVHDIHKELGEGYFNRMKFSTFKRLANELRIYIEGATGQVGRPRYTPNGPISPDVRLACAIRWFAGGSAYDIMRTYGISHTDTINSYWYAVDAINRHPV